MEDKEYELYKKLAALETENANLKSQMDKLSQDSNATQVSEVFESAKKRMYTWIAGLSVVFTLFGFVSINNIIGKIEEKIENTGEQIIIEKVAKQFQDDYAELISERIVGQLQPQIVKKINQLEADFKVANTEFVNSEVERNVRELVLETFKAAQKAQTKNVASTSQPQTNYVEAIEKTYANRNYWVIAASSVRRADVVNELNRVKSLVGPEFEREFPEAKVTEPYPGTSHYPLVLGFDLPYQQAVSLRKKAIEAGFRSDTFLWRAKSS